MCKDTERSQGSYLDLYKISRDATDPVIVLSNSAVLSYQIMTTLQNTENIFKKLTHEISKSFLNSVNSNNNLDHHDKQILLSQLNPMGRSFLSLIQFLIQDSFRRHSAILCLLLMSLVVLHDHRLAPDGWRIFCRGVESSQ
jgi:hypothetical protein